MKTRISALLLLLVLIAGCGGDDKPATSSGDDTPDAQELLESAADATAALKSFHFRLEHENGSIALPLNLELRSAEGDVVVPDRLKAEVDARNGPINISVDALAIGDRTWITNPFTRRYQELPDTSIFDTIDPVELLRVFTSNLENVQLAGSDRVDGTDCWRLTGTMSSDALDSVLPAKGGGNVDFVIWTGKEDNLPRRVRMEGAVTENDEPNTVRVITFSSFDKPVDISPPS